MCLTLNRKSKNFPIERHSQTRGEAKTENGLKKRTKSCRHSASKNNKYHYSEVTSANHSQSLSVPLDHMHSN